MSLPSPSQLKRRFIIKHKKLPEGSEAALLAAKVQEDVTTDVDISTAVKNGELYLEDPIEKEWKVHFFMLTNNKMYYAEAPGDPEGREDEEEEHLYENSSNTASELLPARSQRDHQPLALSISSASASSSTSSSSSSCPKWFHGKMGFRNPDHESSRMLAEDLLTRYSHLGDGVFLVRNSVKFVGDYTLSFWAKGRVNHCRIKTRHDATVTKYYLTPDPDNNPDLMFTSLSSLISHYQSNPLKSNEFPSGVYLKIPAPQVNSHENADWYHRSLNRTQAEELMKRMKYEGSFLVRPSEHEESGFSITFRAEGKIKHCRIQREDKCFLVGRSKFESLTELINWYEKNPLYRKVKLTYPVNEASVRRFGADPETCEDAASSNNNPAGNYMDSSSFNALISVKALYDYTAARDDELSFPKHAIITNVMKQHEAWWRGDYGGKIKYWFPANFVQEIRGENGKGDSDETSSNDPTPLGSLQKGAIDIVNCSVVAIPGTVHNRDHVFRIISPSQPTPIDIAAASQEDLTDWILKIRETAASANEAIKKGKRIEKELKIAKEFSSLIIYCRAVPFASDCIGNFTHMSSFPETKAEKWLSPANVKFFSKYHRHQFTRIYPKGSRLDSSNFDPIRCWNAGVQLVALNYQTADRAMQLNHSKFAMNGACGYVLRPDFMFKDDYDPYTRSRLSAWIQPITLTVRIIAARCLTKNGRGIVSPYVETEIAGADFDCGKHTTNTIRDNGLNPIWNESFVFDIDTPDLAFIRFVVNEEDSFGDPNFLAQATYPVRCLRHGYRSVPLRNEFSEQLELASLLIHVSVRTVKSENGR